MKKIYLIGAALAVLLSTGCSKTALLLNRNQTIETSLPGGARSPVCRVVLPAPPFSSVAEFGGNQNVPGHKYTLIRLKTQRQPGPITYLGTKMTVLLNGVPVDYYFDAHGLPITRPVRRLTAAQFLTSVSDYLSQSAFD